jgi:hypothetical protein
MKPIEAIIARYEQQAEEKELPGNAVETAVEIEFTQLEKLFNWMRDYYDEGITEEQMSAVVMRTHHECGLFTDEQLSIIDEMLYRIRAKITIEAEKLARGTMH